MLNGLALNARQLHGRRRERFAGKDYLLRLVDGKISHGKRGWRDQRRNGQGDEGEFCFHRAAKS